MSLSILPFSLQLPSGYSLTSGSATTSATSSAATTAATAATTASTTASTPAIAANPVDVISISNTAVAGTFTAVAGDIYRMSVLFDASAPTGQTSAGNAIAGYRVGLGAGSGTLQLNGVDVTSQTSFTAAQFAQLTYTTGANATQQSLVVVAQTGSLLSSGAISQEVDSPAVQITANVTGARSINAMSALSVDPTDSDATTASIVQQAGIFTGIGGSTQPTLQTQGNFTAVAGDIYRMNTLFSASAPTGQTIVGYRVGLAAGSGTLQLNGVDVTSQTSFTAAQFAQLTYTTGANATQQNLVVIAQTGTLQSSGAISREVDSPPVQINADVTGTRSINAMGALSVDPTDSDATTASIVQQAGIFTGIGGAARPTMQTEGNFTADAGDVYRMNTLFSASAATGQTIVGYRVGLAAGSGTLQLNGVDVTTQTCFTAAQFAQLTYTTGANATQQSLVVIAQTGTLLSSGAISKEVDSPAVQITANVTGARSINAMSALSVDPTDSDATTASIVQQAGIFTGIGGSTQPTLQTQGNFTAVTGDIYRMSGLFSASAPTGQTIVGYRVGLAAGSGTLQLNGVDVTTQTSFTAAQFAQLTYTTGANATQQNLVVIAQTGTLLSSGAISREVDSPPVQITANVTGSRSINAMSALSVDPTDSDATTASIVQQAGIFTGIGGAARPTMQTDGNFTADAGDVYRMNTLFSASAPAGQTIVGYRVGLAAGSGTLQLNGVDVTTQTSFTAAQFAQLTYTAGANATQQSLVVIAQTGKLLSSGAISKEVDSPAVQITANVTGTRSINAMSALSVDPTDSDANIASIVQQAGIFTGIGGSARPTLQTAITQQPALSPSELEASTGAFMSAGLSNATKAIDLSPFYPSAIGSSVSPGAPASPGGSLATALLLLDGTATGSFEVADNLTSQAEGIRAYATANSL